MSTLSPHRSLSFCTGKRGGIGLQAFSKSQYFRASVRVSLVFLVHFGNNPLKNNMPPLRTLMLLLLARSVGPSVRPSVRLPADRCRRCCCGDTITTIAHLLARSPRRSGSTRQLRRGGPRAGWSQRGGGGKNNRYTGSRDGYERTNERTNGERRGIGGSGNV